MRPLTVNAASAVAGVVISFPNTLLVPRSAVGENIVRVGGPIDDHTQKCDTYRQADDYGSHLPVRQFSAHRSPLPLLPAVGEESLQCGFSVGFFVNGELEESFALSLRVFINPERHLDDDSPVVAV